MAVRLPASRVLPQEDSWYPFPLDAESTPRPQYMNLIVKQFRYVQATAYYPTPEHSLPARFPKQPLFPGKGTHDYGLVTVTVYSSL
jgi:hypothetical protein